MAEKNRKTSRELVVWKFFTPRLEQFAHAALDLSAFIVRNSCPDAFFVELHAERLLWWNLLAGRDPRVPAHISPGEKT